MVQLTTRERVDAFWAGRLGVDTRELHLPGVRVRPHPPAQAPWRGIYVMCFDDAACVGVPADRFDEISAMVADLDPLSLIEPETWRRLLGEDEAYGPVLHFYRDDVNGLAEIAAGRRINPNDAGALTALRSAVSAQEWMLAGFLAQPAMLFGLFEDDRMVAAANLTSGPDAATDIGVVLHPDVRGRGYAARLTATAARQALVMHGIARYRALATSPAAIAVAEGLGFGEYGRNIAVYLRD